MAIDREPMASLNEKGESNSTIAKELQIRRDTLLNVKFLLVREHQIGQHDIFHEVQKVSTSFDPHSFMRGCELMALLHLVGEGLEVLLKDAVHRSLADSSLCG